MNKHSDRNRPAAAPHDDARHLHELRLHLHRSLEIIEAQPGGMDASTPASAAADGWAPLSGADDFAILHIGRKLGTFRAELSRVEAVKAHATDVPQRIYAEDGIDHLSDGLHYLRWALAGLKASSIPAAAIQCASAVTLLEELEGQDNAHEAEVRRALHRLVASAANVLSQAAGAVSGAGRAESGLDHLFPLHLDPWATLEDRLASI